MPVPALLWGLAQRPRHLVSGQPAGGDGAAGTRPTLPIAELEQFHADWFVAALAVHAVLSLGFGLAFGLVLPRLPAIPGPLAWGGLLMPLLWTASSYGLMGVVNPVLQERVDWPWFIVSQFVFGSWRRRSSCASEKIDIPPAGRGPDRSAEYLAE